MNDVGYTGTLMFVTRYIVIYYVVQTMRFPPTGMATGMSISTTGIPAMVDPHKLDAIKRAADSIIHEKDNIIEK